LLSRSDIRFQTSGSIVSAATSFTLPIRLTIVRPTAESALNEAKRLADALAAAASGFAQSAGQLTLADPASGAELYVEQFRRDEVRLCLTLLLILTPPTGVDFWTRATSIVRANDLVQQFAQKSLAKGIELEPGLAEPITDSQQVTEQGKSLK
jgi:hypothetical protein